MQKWEYKSISISTVFVPAPPMHGVPMMPPMPCPPLPPEKRCKPDNTFKSELDKKCAELGEDGWEMVSCISLEGGLRCILLFKRPKQ